MDWSTLLSPAATFIVGLFMYLSPPAKKRRQQRHAADIRMLGQAAVLDRSGDVLVPGVPSLAAQVDDMAAVITQASLLNGQGEKLVADVKKMAAGFSEIRAEARAAKVLAGEAAAQTATLQEDVTAIRDLLGKR
jgi:hypothetical protein